MENKGTAKRVQTLRLSSGTNALSKGAVRTPLLVIAHTPAHDGTACCCKIEVDEKHAGGCIDLTGNIKHKDERE